jgi:hypothetical protein
MRIHQILSLLKLDSLIIQELEKLGNPIKSKIITELMLRPYTNKSLQEQTILLNILKTFFLDKKLDPLVLAKGSKDKNHFLHTTIFLKE